MTDRIDRDPTFRPTLEDELRSLQRFVSLKFTDAEIRWDMPEEGEPYDILIEIPNSTSTRGSSYHANVAHGIVLYGQCQTMIEAVQMKEGLVRLFEQGIPIIDTTTDPDTVLTATGWPRLIPLWDWPEGFDPATDTRPAIRDAKAFLRLRDDVSARIEPQREPREFTVIVEFTARAVRASRELPVAPVITTINPRNTWKV